MNYTITLIVSTIVIGIGIILFLIYRKVYENQSRSMLSGSIKKIRLPKVSVVRNRFIILALVMIIPVFIIDTAFIPRNHCSSAYDYRSVNKWESRLNADPAYTMCICAEGYPVFKHPNAAFLRLFIDNPKGVLHLMSHLQSPLTRLNYAKFMNFQNAGNYLTTDPTVIAQVDRIKFILGIYDNSYDKYLVPIDERGDQTTMNGILDLGFEYTESLNYAFLDDGTKIESEEGYAYLYVRFYIENLTKEPYTIKENSIKIVGGTKAREIISTKDKNNIDIDLTGEIAAGSMRSGLLVVKVDDIANNTLQFTDDRISIKAFEFKIE